MSYIYGAGAKHDDEPQWFFSLCWGSTISFIAVLTICHILIYLCSGGQTVRVAAARKGPVRITIIKAGNS